MVTEVILHSACLRVKSHSLGSGERERMLLYYLPIQRKRAHVWRQRQDLCFTTYVMYVVDSCCTFVRFLHVSQL